MKATILFLLTIPFAHLLSCKKSENPPQEENSGMYGVYDNFGTSVRIMDGQGTDLLDPKTGRYTYEDIDVMVWRGKKNVPYRSYELESPVFSDYPKGYSIHNRAGTLPYYILGTSFPIGNKEDIGKEWQDVSVEGRSQGFPFGNEALAVVWRW